MRPLGAGQIAQLVAETKAELQRSGIDTEGKRPEEITELVKVNS